MVFIWCQWVPIMCHWVSIVCQLVPISCHWEYIRCHWVFIWCQWVLIILIMNVHKLSLSVHKVSLSVHKVSLNVSNIQIWSKSLNLKCSIYGTHRISLRKFLCWFDVGFKYICECFLAYIYFEWLLTHTNDEKKLIKTFEWDHS